jgi:hypothetical protein
MGLITSGIPKEYVLALQKEFGLTWFVETGTFKGATAKWAAQWFEQVITIELSETFYERAKVALAPYRNVKILFGDTRHHLAQIASTLPPSIIWLDAHYSAGDTAGAGDQCPLLGEIDALSPSWNRLFVLVDDARYFLAPPPPPQNMSQWPSMVQVTNALDRGADRFVATFEDVIVSLPIEAKRVTLEYIQKGGPLNERVLGYVRERPRNPVKVKEPPENMLKRIARRLRLRRRQQQP